jgi:hypothetical protein
VAVGDQPDQPIPVTVPVALEGGQQLVHLGLGQMLPDPVGIVPAVLLSDWSHYDTLLACRSWTILPDISSASRSQLIA